MNVLKRFTSIVSALALSASLFGASALADETAADKIGLSASNDKSGQIFVKGDCVWAFSHPWNGDRILQIYPFYNNYLSSSNGYTLRMTNADKEQYPGSEVGNPVVGGSFLRAVKGDETIYVPIVDQAEAAADTGINQGFFDGWKPNENYRNNLVKNGVFGRGFDESAVVFEIPENAENTSSIRTEYSFGSGLTESTAPITLEVSAYVDGNATAMISKDGGNELIKIGADGSCTYLKNGAWTDTGLSLAQNQWHRIAITVDKPKGDFSTIWIDGKEFQQCGIWNQLPSGIRFGTASGSGAGNIAYADPRVYYGYYRAVYDSVNVTDTSASVSVDTANKMIKYSSEDITSAEALENEVKSITDARAVKVYTNEYKEAFGLTDSSIAVVVPKSGGISYEYSLEKRAVPPLQKLSLKFSSTYEFGYTWVGNSEQKPNYYVKTDGENLVVLSSANDGGAPYAYKVLNAANSSAGYEFSIVDSSKQMTRAGLVMNEDNTRPITGTRSIDKVVAGDYLKGVNGDEEIYIPIVNKIDILRYTNIGSVGGHNWQGAVAEIGDAFGAAGKAADDISYSLTAASEPTSKLAKYQLDNAEMSKYYDAKPYTYAVNVYADGNAIAKICTSDGVDNSNGGILTWNTDGSIAYDVSGTYTEGGKLARGMWHRVAVSYDPMRGRRHVWLDGKLLTDTNGGFNANGVGRIDLGIKAGSTSGKVLYDDFRLYDGFYDPAEDVVSVTADNASAFDGKIRYTSEITSLDALKAELGCDVKLFADDSFTETGSLDNASLALIVSESGDGYNYFTLEKTEKSDMLSVSEENSRFIARAAYKVPEGSILYIASYDSESGALVDLKSATVGKDGIAYLSTEASAVQKAFLWNTNFKPLTAAK